MDQLETSFDRNPPGQVCEYDQNIRMFCAAYDAIFPMAYAALRPYLGAHAVLLIVGAGTGMELCEFGRRSPDWSMTGVDPSAGMLAIARNRITTQGISNPIQLFQGFTHDLPETDRFDGATCILVMHFLPDDGSKLSLLESIGRRLKPGAPLVLVDGFGDRESTDFHKVLGAWRAFPAAMGVEPEVVQDAFDNTILKLLKFVPEERIKSLLSEAGFIEPARFFTGFLYGGWVTFKK